MLALRRPVSPILRRRHPVRVAASPTSIEIMRSFDFMDLTTSCVLLICGIGMVVVDLAHQSAWKERENRGYHSDDGDGDDDDQGFHGDMTKFR